MQAAGVGTLGIGYMAATNGLKQAKAASNSFSGVETPTSKSLNDVTYSAVGPIAVGDSGRILKRDATGWKLVETSGIAGSGRTLTGVTATTNGSLVWMCGSSGAVAAYDVYEDRIFDYSSPNGVSNNWSDIIVHGSSRDEFVVVVNRSGQLVTGERTGCREFDWNQTQTPTGNSISDIHRVGFEHYRIVGGSGTVYESTDKCQTWSQIGVANFGQPLNGMSSPLSRQNGTFPGSAVGNTGSIVDYNGSTWQSTNLVSTSINDVYRNGQAGMAVGNGGVIFERVDGVWSSSSSPTDVKLNTIEESPSSDHPDIIVGDRGTVLEKGSISEYNTKIVVQHIGNAEAGYSLSVTGGAEVGIDGDSGESVTTSDGLSVVDGLVNGANANYRDSFNFSGDVDDFTLDSPEGSNIAVTVNGDRVSIPRIAKTTWTQASTPVSVSLYSITDSSAGPVAVGGGGKLLLRDSGNWSEVVKNGPGSNGNTQRVAETTNSGNIVWFGGSSGSLGTYDASNSELVDRTAPQNVTNSWTAMEVVGSRGSETVVLGSGSGEILTGTRSSSGMQWNDPITPGSGSGISGMDFISSQLGYICDTNGSVFKTNDAGSTWTEIGIPNAPGTPNDISAKSETDIAVAGGSGFLMWYNGDVWSSRKFGGKTRRAVSRVGDRTLLVGSSGTIQSRGLKSWETIFDGSKALNDVVMYKDQNETAIAVGNSGRIFEQSFDSTTY